MKDSPPPTSVGPVEVLLILQVNLMTAGLMVIQVAHGLGFTISIAVFLIIDNPDLQVNFYSFLPGWPSIPAIIGMLCGLITAITAASSKKRFIWVWSIIPVAYLLWSLVYVEGLWTPGVPTQLMPALLVLAVSSAVNPMVVWLTDRRIKELAADGLV